MIQTISRKTLCGYFSLLRQTLQCFQMPHNVIFLNSRAFYCHTANLPCGDTTIGNILTDMECCIPFACNEYTWKSFCNNTLKTEHFLESSKADFLLLLLSAIQDDTHWQALLRLCENLRQKHIEKGNCNHETLY